MSKEEIEQFCDMRLRALPDFSDYTDCLISMAYLPPLSELHPAIRDMIECALAAAEQGDEEAFYACYNFGHPRESCTELDTNWCDGDELATCDSDGEVSYWPCAAFGDRCMYDEQRGEYTCALPCPEGRAEGESWCDGQWQNECSGGLLSRVSCSNVGLVCIEEELGAACVPSSTPCDSETFEPHCDGDVYVVCWAGYVMEQDCKENIFLTVCGTWNQQLFGCIADPISCTESHCDGDVANICIAGEPFVYDCTQLGLACVPEGSGTQVTCGDIATR
ncbi:MAG: hypothetical protein ABIK83_14085 [Candidatus Zixiibacteriota bacterium]